jgi:DNA gyrase subunit A
MRGVVDIEEDDRGRTCLVITELPYQVNPDTLAAKIAELVRRRQGDRHRRHARRLLGPHRAAAGHRAQARRPAKVVLSNLYKHTQLQETFGANMLALVDGVPRTLSLDAVRHATGSTTRSRSSSGAPQYRLRKAEERAHILRGYLKALDALDEVIALIRRSPTVEDARVGLMELLDIDEIQATAILDMQLRRLAALERQKIIDEPRSSSAPSPTTRTSSPTRPPAPIVSEELAEIVDKYGDERRTQIMPADGDMRRGPDPDEDVVVTHHRAAATPSARIPPVPLAASRRQGRQGRAAARRRRGGALLRHHARTTGSCSSPTSAGSTGRRRTAARGRARRQGQHVANLLAFQPDEKQIAGCSRCATTSRRRVPGAGHQARAGEEDLVDRVRHQPHRRADRDQPEGRRRAGGVRVAAISDKRWRARRRA